jgi:two-component system, NarL family, nitrate/nitrite response regulator NarL
MKGKGEHRHISVTIVSEQLLQRLSLATLLRSLAIKVDFLVSKVEALPASLEDGQNRTNVLLLDLDKPAASDDQTEWTVILRDVTRRHPELRAVVLSDTISVDDLAWGLSVGISGFLYKSVSPDRLLKSLELVVAGEAVLPMDLAKSLMAKTDISERGMSGDPALLQSLSDREVAVLNHLQTGGSNKVIARALHVAEGTVKVHVKGIIRKLGVQNRTQAALWAVKNMPSEMTDRGGRNGHAGNGHAGNGHAGNGSAPRSLSSRQLHARHRATHYAA